MRSRTTARTPIALALALAAVAGVAAAGATHAGIVREDVTTLRIERAALHSIAIPRPAASGLARIGTAAPAPEKLWVFFTDKALTRDGERTAIELAAAELSPRALWRRSKVGMQVNRNDVPVAASYVDAVAATGAHIVVKSRWMNAVSVVADAAQATAVARLPFVKEVRPVARATREIPEIIPATAVPPSGAGRALDYGPSLGQLDQIQVTDLHADGFDGTGVLIAMFDTGFDTNHQTYRHLALVAERDFINNDGETANEPGDPWGQDSHGTSTLSCVGGAYAGQLYGGSYNASFVLAKTERVDTEIQAEEDYWVAAAEWADSLGADVISSSLGYLDWYTYEDMDGNTAVTTIAADMAAARGIVVVNSMGNEGDNPWLYMIAPADGDSVVSVGAVDSGGARTYFSSVGPTHDGRTKPDVMALGLYTYVATTSDTATYGYSSGTSFSCPLTAGAVGLLLQGHPEWTPSDVLEALRSSATQSGSPDTLMGWGIVQAHDAMDSGSAGAPESGVLAQRAVSASPNPFGFGTTVRYAVPADARVRVTVHDVAGRVVRVLFDGVRRTGSHTIGWHGTDAAGARVASGTYFVRVDGGGAARVAKVTMLR
jgi:serine protease AprX